MREDASGRRQRAVMATDAEWERIGRAAAASGMDLSRFVIHRALDRDPLPPEVLRRAVREMLVLSRLEERRLREAGAGEAWEDACDAVDEWIDREGMLDGLTDPGAANRPPVGPQGLDRTGLHRGAEPPHRHRPAWRDGPRRSAPPRPRHARTYPRGR